MAYDLTTPTGVAAKMKQSRNEQEWNENVDKVKEANNGLPDFWFATIVIGGVMANTSARWRRQDSE